MDFEHPPNIRFRCVKCGICCGDTDVKTRQILMLKTEAQQISEATMKPVSEFAVKIEGKEPYSFVMAKTAKDEKCIFLSENKCKIYALRPLICRFYPFELTMSGPRKYKFTPTDECLGIGKGKIREKDYFGKLLRLAQSRMKVNKG